MTGAVEIVDRTGSEADGTVCRESIAVDFDGVGTLLGILGEGFSGAELSGTNMDGFVDVGLSTNGFGGVTIGTCSWEDVGMCHVTESLAVRWYKANVRAQARRVATVANLTRLCCKRTMLTQSRRTTWPSRAVVSRVVGGEIEVRNEEATFVKSHGLGNQATVHLGAAM